MAVLYDGPEAGLGVRRKPGVAPEAADGFGQERECYCAAGAIRNGTNLILFHGRYSHSATVDNPSH
jgi:hypothetical protein